MTLTDFAKHFCKFWHHTQQGWQLADNAPPEIGRFVARAGGTHAQEMRRVAFVELGHQRIEPTPDPTWLKQWLAAEPDAHGYVNKGLSTLKGPTTFQDLLSAAYRAAMIDEAATVRGFLEHYLTLNV